MIRRNLNPTSEQQGKSVAERVAAALKAQSTTPTGVKDLGEDGDVLWTNTDTSVSTSVREQEAFTSQLSDKLAAAQQTLDQAQDDIDQAQKSASDAATQAATAVAAAAGLVSASIAAPSSPPSGAIWFPLDASGRVIGMKLWNGTAWAPYVLMADQLLVPGSVGTVSIADGKITTPKLAADVLNVGNLTATGTSTLAKAVAQAVWAGVVNAQVANIQDLHATTGAIDSAVIGKITAQIITSSQFWTALSGARIGIDSTGIHAFNSAGTETVRINGISNRIAGDLISGNAHLTSWSDGSGNTRSGIILDDAAGAVASDSAAKTKPRLISTKDASGKVDTFLSTGVDASGNQALVQASQSMNKASMVASGPTGGAEILVNMSGQAFINGKCFTNGNALLSYLGSGNMQVGTATSSSYWVISGGSVVIPHAGNPATIYFGSTYTAVASVVVTNGDTLAQHGYITLGGVASTKFDVYTSGIDNNGPMRINYMVLGSIG